MYRFAMLVLYMRACIENLPARLRDFLEAHESYAIADDKPTDGSLAAMLGVSRVTIIARRKRIRQLGIDLPSLSPRGFQHQIDRDQGYLFAIH